MPSTPVRRIDLDGTRPVVVTDSLTIAADRLIVAAGAWVKHLFPKLPVPLVATRQQVLYFRPSDPAPFRIGRFPVFIFKGSGEAEAFYGMPGFLGNLIPALAGAPIDLAETCLYTVAADEHFLVDFLPGRSDVIVASPCSGHGFKFSCLIGQVLADMATGGPGN